MDAFKEFQGKDLDTAIEEACSYFNVARDQLEIEIVRDAKTGIFGIVGTRKAAIRARRVHLEKAAPFVPDMKLGFALSPHKPRLPALRLDPFGENVEKSSEPEIRPKAPSRAVQQEKFRENAAQASQAASPGQPEAGARDERTSAKSAASAPAESPVSLDGRPAFGAGEAGKEGQPEKGQDGREVKGPSSQHQRKNSRHSGRRKKGGEGRENEARPDERKTDASESEQKESAPKENGRKGSHRKNQPRRPSDTRDAERKEGQKKESAQKNPEAKEQGRKGRETRSSAHESVHHGPKRARQQRQVQRKEVTDINFSENFSEKDVDSFMMADIPYDFADMPEEIPEGLPLISKEQLASPEFQEKLETILMRIIEPIIGIRVGLQFEVYQNSVRVHIDSGSHSGLLIGREGQTLIAIQYLTSRILTHTLGTAVRLQLDAGEYRQRQEEKLGDIALSLADRARQTGRSFSTRPLSSYHRRIIHMRLQDAEDIQTRSIGEGSMKRVIISLRRARENGKAES